MPALNRERLFAVEIDPGVPLAMDDCYKLVRLSGPAAQRLARVYAAKLRCALMVVQWERHDGSGTPTKIARYAPSGEPEAPCPSCGGRGYHEQDDYDPGSWLPRGHRCERCGGTGWEL
jgi:hypothetical protein